jgi:enoyl-CoA hydratase
MSAPSIHVEQQDRVVVITIDRPHVRNAIDAATAHDIENAFDVAEADPDVWAIVLGAVGPVFCAGADLRAVALGGTAMTSRGGFAGLTSRRRSKPLIAAVDGPALGGGFEVVLACDMVVAGPTAEFGLPEVRRALVAGGGGLVRLPHRLARNVAFELAVTGATIGVTRALTLGLVNRLAVDETAIAAAHTLAGEVVANPPVAVAVAMDVINASSENGETAGWLRSDAAMVVIQASEDFLEGPRAFLEKRAPVWTGR